MTTTEAFDRGAAKYDRLVSLNPGYHRELRRAATALVDRVGRDHDSQDLRFLDMACGSGASTRALLQAAPGAEVVGLDASAGMLAQARAKQWPDTVRFIHATAGDLDVDEIGRASFDGIQACYLFRNIPEDQRDHALSETYDLLRPGGWLEVVEYSVADDPKARRVWDAVSHTVIIPLGALIDRNPGLYRYLWRSVIEFDGLDVFAGRLAKAGFTDIAHRTANGWQRGILHTFVARKPEESS